MQILIRAAFFALSLATITPVANAAGTNDMPTAPPQDSTASWVNG